MTIPIDEFIDRKVVVLHESDTVTQAARAMCHNNVGCILVSSKNGSISGLLTDRDLVCNSLAGYLSAETPLYKIVETNLVYLTSGSEVDDAIELMKLHGIRRIPIIEEHRRGRLKCIGIVTLDDLVAGQFVSSEDIGEIVRSQIVRREKRAKGSQKNGKLRQSYQKFISKFNDEFDLEETVTDEIVRFLTAAIVQRLHYTGSAQFIAQIPKRLQDDLLDLPAGPNRGITERSLVQGVSIRTGIKLTECRDLIEDFWRVLSSYISKGEAEHILMQLPLPLRRLFLGEPTEKVSSSVTQLFI